MARQLPRFHSADGCLDAEMRSAFAEDGCLILEDFVATDDCQRLIVRAGQLVDEFNPEADLTIFSTNNQSHKSDHYFRESGDKVRFFFEPESMTSSGQLIGDKSLSINKIGHALHDLDPVFSTFSRAPALAQVAQSLAIAEPLLLQSMYIFKQPRIGAEVNCHQDSTFLHTEPLSCVGFWFALEDATIENGCLYAIPGRFPLKQRFHYRDDELVMTIADDSEWALDQAVALEVPQGTMIVLDGLLPHFSTPNRSPVSRQAYTLHVVDGHSHYVEDNWLQRPETMPLRGF